MQVHGKGIYLGHKKINSSKGEFLIINLEISEDTIAEFFISKEYIAEVKKSLPTLKKYNPAECIFKVTKRGQYINLELIAIGN